MRRDDKTMIYTLCRRTVRSFVLLLLCSLACPFVTLKADTRQKERTPRSLDRPNILLLISDDQSTDSIGAYGNPAAHTPNLDKLAGEGARFTHAFVTSPQCSPSRSSFYTGQFPHTIGTSRLHAPLRPPHSDILGLLKQTGYYTGALRKVHLGSEFESKFDFRDAGAANGAGARSFTKFFASRPKNKPFFLQVGFRDPHRPYAGAAFQPATDPARVRVPAFLPDTPAVRADLANYHDHVARMDREIGELLRLLDDENLSRNTLVVFVGDNGMPFAGAKGSLYEAGINVPLMIRWTNKIEPGQTRGELISLVDLSPTLLAAANTSAPPGSYGRSFLDLPAGDPYRPREAVYSERNWHDTLDFARCVRDNRYKLIRNFRAEIPYLPTLDLSAAQSPAWASVLELRSAGKLSSALERRYFAAPRPEIELYDLERDPGEFDNLAGKAGHAATQRRLLEDLSRWMNETNDFLPPPFAAQNTQLRAGAHR